MKKTLLWLDDLRNPADYLNIEEFNIIWAHSYDEFVNYFQMERCMPDVIWFDHDLGGEKDGYDCAKWLIAFCEDTQTPLALEIYSQSQNPVGKENILSIIKNYKKFQKLYI